jgi:hypothetical protein
MLAVYDSELNCLCHKQISYYGYKPLKLAELNGLIIVCFTSENEQRYGYDYDEYDEEDRNASNISKFDANLKKIHEIRVKCGISSVDSYEKSLYCLSTAKKASKHRCVYVYDESLTLTKRIDGPEAGQPFHLPSSFIKIQVSEELFIFWNNKEVVVMDKQSGVVKSRFGVNANASDVFLHAGLNVLAYNVKQRQLIVYDLDGKEQKFSLNLMESQKKCILLADCCKEKFIFVDPQGLCLYF